MPKEWYNLAADLPTPDGFLLLALMDKPVSADQMTAIFPPVL
jgi:predicted alternative tryptophan synthase beta-subunit